MPTYDEEGQFQGDYQRLTPAQRKAFLAAVREFVADLKAQRPFRQTLRVKPISGHAGIFEMTWDWPDGRATFRYGPEQKPGEVHIIWRRVGGHDIFKKPLSAIRQPLRQPTRTKTEDDGTHSAQNPENTGVGGQ